MPFATINPATGETLKTFESLTDAQVQEKLQKASEAYRQHKQTSFADRAGKMIRAAQILDAEKQSIARTMTLEVGKTLRSSVEEVEKCVKCCYYYAGNAERLLADEPYEVEGARAFIRYRPIGPVLAVMPWNFPFWQVVRFAAPTLMAGNVGLLKHSENVPQSALLLEDLFRRAGFPEGAFQTLLIELPQVSIVLDDPCVAAATLTGSERAGSAVAERAGKQIKKTVLELGGSDPFIVMPSADLDAAVETAVKARTVNNGQSCIAGKRFIVAESIADEFTRRFVGSMESLIVGDPLDEKTNIGPLAMPKILDGLDAQVQKSVAMGAKVLTGGKQMNRPGNFYPPTVLTDISPDSPAYSEEFFGPVALLFRVNGLDEALRLANDIPFGLGSSVWTTDPAEQEHFINEIEAGMTFVNGMVASDPRLPFGGIKRSGYGRELSEHGLREFTNMKTVCIVSSGNTAWKASETE